MKSLLCIILCYCQLPIINSVALFLAPSLVSLSYTYLGEVSILPWVFLQIEFIQFCTAHASKDSIKYVEVPLLTQLYRTERIDTKCYENDWCSHGGVATKCKLELQVCPELYSFVRLLYVVQFMTTLRSDSWIGCIVHKLNTIGSFFSNLVHKPGLL